MPCGAGVGAGPFHEGSLIGFLTGQQGVVLGAITFIWKLLEHLRWVLGINRLNH